MLISSAYAQAAGQVGGDMFSLLMPMIFVFGIIYFLMIRPQQRRQKEHQAKLAAAKRGDKVITGGGVKGVVRKVSDDGTLTVEISKDVQIEVLGSTLMDVLAKGEPQAAAKKDQAPRGLMASLFGGGAKAETPAASPKESPAEPEAVSKKTTKKNTNKTTKKATSKTDKKTSSKTSKKTTASKPSNAVGNAEPTEPVSADEDKPKN